VGELIDYLPTQYRDSPEVRELQQAFGKWADMLHTDSEDLIEQFFIGSATWGLRVWEAALWLESDADKTYEFRRTRIESKLRGLGTATKAMIMNVASSFSNGEAEVIEHNSEYWFDIKFVGTIGIPPNMDDLTAAIEEIKPAHLSYAYSYRYRIYGELKNHTHTSMKPFTHTQIRNGAIKIG